KPALAKKSPVEGEPKTRRPGDEHRRYHDEAQQPALHRLEHLRLRARTDASVIDEEPRQVQKPRHPGDDGDHMQRLDPEMHQGLLSRTSRTSPSTCSTGVCGSP